MKSINLLFTKSTNNVIGRENEMLWYLSKEDTEFRDKTKNQIVLMGMRTWETIPTVQKPFSDRVNIIVTRDKSFTYYDDNVNVVYDLEWYLNEYKNSDTDKQLWIIGGGQILSQSVKYADNIEVIEIDTMVTGEIKAPKIDGRSFRLHNSTEMKTDSFSGIDYFKSYYQRISASWLETN
jgi:dihydrofolate reductase